MNARNYLSLCCLSLLLVLSACTGQTKQGESTSASAEPTSSASVTTQSESAPSEESASAEESSSEELTPEQVIYLEIMQNYPSITMKDVEKAIAEKEDLLFYAGRVTCPYCVKFTPTMQKIVRDHDLALSAVDTEKEDGFLDFAKAHGIEYIPALIYVKDGQVYPVKMDDPYPRADVEAAMKEVGITLK